MLLAEFPDLVLDGMTIAGYAFGARHGILYLRGEYTYLYDDLQKRLIARRDAHLLGESVCNRDLRQNSMQTCPRSATANG